MSPRLQRRDGHALIIGGTGMLSFATQDIARRWKRVTLVARTEESLRRAADRSVLVPHLIPADWDRPEEFLGILREHRRRVGPADFVLAWLHDGALAAPAAAAACGDRPCTFFHVRGSAEARPQGADAARAAAAEAPARNSGVPPAAGPEWPPTVSRHEIILGFHREGGRSRWLTHAEISAGILDAIRHGDRRHIVGTVRPWEHRPSAPSGAGAGKAAVESPLREHPDE